jgi:hypothetical protein
MERQLSALARLLNHFGILNVGVFCKIFLLNETKTKEDPNAGS